MINKITIGPLNGYELTFKEAKMSIIHDLGCNINLLTLKNNKILDTNSQFQDLVQNTLFKSNFLIPFPYRIAGGTYTFEGATYQFDKNEEATGHALHGLFTKRKFELQSSNIQQDYVSVSFETTLKSDEYPGYPFDIHTVITFKLRTDSLDINVTTENVGNRNAPYGIGWLPYLTVGKKIDECQISIPAESELEISTERQLIPTGNKMHNVFGTEKRLLGNKTIDTCFTDLVSDTAEFENLELWMDPSMEFLQIYTPADRQSIAMVPMCCAPDAFNNGMGLIVLRPKEKTSHNFGIRVK